MDDIKIIEIVKKKTNYKYKNPGKENRCGICSGYSNVFSFCFILGYEVNNNYICNEYRGRIKL